MADSRHAVYCTLLMSDSYLPGAMVLAHSLRDCGTKARLAILVTLDSLKPSTITELKTIYDDIIPINRVSNVYPANLFLMNRPDLISTFSKIELWRQTQYKQIVYLDADVIALRAPDELLTLDTQFAAVPDIGWPDCFNSGVMVLRPNLQDYYALLAFADKGISFDGADQGLLNMHFRNWRRLSFTYNCTPSGHYQYVPAFRHFQSTVSLVHFIGPQKPWNSSRYGIGPVENPYNQLLGRWWAVYDSHYRPMIFSAGAQDTREVEPSQFQQHYGEQFQLPPVYYAPPTAREDAATEDKPFWPPMAEDREAWHVDEGQIHGQSQMQDLSHSTSSGITLPESSYIPPVEHQPTQHISHPMPAIPHPQPHDGEQVQPQDMASSLADRAVAGSEQVVHWEAQPPPTVPHKRHEYILSAVPQYVAGEEMVSVYRPISPDFISPPAAEEPPHHDISFLPTPHHPPPPPPPQSPPIPPLTEPPKPAEAHHVPPGPPPAAVPLHEPVQRPPSPLKVEWDASRAPPPMDSKPEGFSLPSRTYTMSQDTQLFQPPKSYPDAPKDMYYEVPPKPTEPAEPARVFPWEGSAPPPSRVFLDEDAEPQEVTESSAELSTAGDQERKDHWTSTLSGSSQRLWESYVRANAWDEIPEIERYMQSIQPQRKAKVQVISGGPAPRKATFSNIGERRPSMKVADFPTELERPSLPVTPAPIRRTSYWGQEGEEEEGGERVGGGGQLPAAEGVPNQQDWNPLERLEELQRRQSMFLKQPDMPAPRYIPERKLPGL